MPKPKKKPSEDGGNKGSENKIIANDDGSVTVNGKKYILKDSYDAVANKYKKMKGDAEKLKEEELKEQNKFKELAEKREAENKELKEQAQKQSKINALVIEATKNGVVDSDALTKLADLSKIEVSEDGAINQESVKTLVAGMKEEKAYLFGNKVDDNIGSEGGAPSGGGGDAPHFKRSQLQDADFYQKNEEDILKAYAAGNIEDDVTPQAPQE